MDDDHASSMPEEAQACPFCLETIRKGALKCRYCGEFLETGARTGAVQDANKAGPTLRATLVSLVAVVAICAGVVYAVQEWRRRDAAKPPASQADLPTRKRDEEQRSDRENMAQPRPLLEHAPPASDPTRVPKAPDTKPVPKPVPKPDPKPAPKPWAEQLSLFKVAVEARQFRAAREHLERARELGVPAGAVPGRMLKRLTKYEAPRPPPPLWAKVGPEQVEEARRFDVPVAFENSIGIKFVLIPSGEFWMGADERSDRVGKLYIRFAESPRHKVVLTEPYYLSIHEVTNRQLRAFSPSYTSTQGGLHPEYPVNGPDQPAMSVAFEDAVRFARWLSARDSSRTYGLPTEAQWERAARGPGGGASILPWDGGEARGHLYANMLDPNGGKPVTSRNVGDPWTENDGFAATAPVGSFRPNDYGLYDMIGNVWEFCADVYVKDFYSSKKASIDPISGSVSDRRDHVMRGWCYMSSGWCALTARWDAPFGPAGLGFYPVGCRLMATTGSLTAKPSGR